MIWIASDLHFSHNKDFIYKSRGFSSAQEMNETIVDRWNQTISDDDDVYLLGDVILTDTVDGMKYFSKLKGKIHLIHGNHDTDARWALYSNLTAPNIVEMQNSIFLDYKKYHFYLSHYPSLTDNYDVDKPLKTKVINLCGHTHTSDRFADFNKGLIYHCDMDAHNCFPVSLDGIIEEIKNKYKGEN